MDNLFKNHSKKIRIYLAKETIVDPIEKNVSLTQLNSLPIRAIVSDLTFAKIQWAMPGIVADKAKEIIIEKKYRTLLEQSAIIEIETELYEGWKVNGKMQIREEGDYLRCYIYTKKV